MSSKEEYIVLKKLAQNLLAALEHQVRINGTANLDAHRNIIVREGSLIHTARKLLSEPTNGELE